MAARPQNVGIKAIEIYFPSQVRLMCMRVRARAGVVGHECPALALLSWHSACPYACSSLPLDGSYTS